MDISQNVLDEKAVTYKRLFGDKALEEVIKEKENFYTFMGKNDYIEISYQENKEVKHIKLVGDLLEFSEYIISKINAKYPIVLIKRINDIYTPMEKFEVGDYL